MSNRTLVTGFLPFGGHAVNPSALLAPTVDAPYELLEVSFTAVDTFIDRLNDPPAFDQIVMLGLSGEAQTIRLEQVARNHVGAAPDVRGVVRGPGPIEQGGPAALHTTLLRPPTLSSLFVVSDDAGSYLCNYIFYRVLRRLPHKPAVFIHVPRTEVMPLDTQRDEIARLLAALRSA